MRKQYVLVTLKLTEKAKIATVKSLSILCEIRKVYTYISRYQISRINKQHKLQSFVHCGTIKRCEYDLLEYEVV